jgi:hypothetical protein
MLISSAFNMAECLLWLESVGNSLVMQLFVTDPLMALTVMSLKLFFSWVLVTVTRIRNERRREDMFTKREVKLAAAEVEVLQHLASIHCKHLENGGGAGGGVGDVLRRRQQSASLEARRRHTHALLSARHAPAALPAFLAYRPGGCRSFSHCHSFDDMNVFSRLRCC